MGHKEHHDKKHRTLESLRIHKILVRSAYRLSTLEYLLNFNSHLAPLVMPRESYHMFESSTY